MDHPLDDCLRSVLAVPDDDTPRLAYADCLADLPDVYKPCQWCDGTGVSLGAGRGDPPCDVCKGSRDVNTTENELVATFIRQSVELARLTEPPLHGVDDGDSEPLPPTCVECLKAAVSALPPGGSDRDWLTNPLVYCRYHQLALDVSRLVGTAGAKVIRGLPSPGPEVAWAYGLADRDYAPPAAAHQPTARISRGFVSEVHLTAQQYRTLAPGIFGAAPVTRVVFSDRRPMENRGSSNADSPGWDVVYYHWISDREQGVMNFASSLRHRSALPEAVYHELRALGYATGSTRGSIYSTITSEPMAMECASRAAVVAGRKAAAGRCRWVPCKRCGGAGCNDTDRHRAGMDVGQYLAEQLDEYGRLSTTNPGHKNMAEKPAAACDGSGQLELPGLEPYTFPQDLNDCRY